MRNLVAPPLPLGAGTPDYRLLLTQESASRCNFSLAIFGTFHKRICQLFLLNFSQDINMKSIKLAVPKISRGMCWNIVINEYINLMSSVGAPNSSL
jgi:hypothetical protein